MNQGFNLVSKGFSNGGLGCLMYWSFISTVAISLEVVLLMSFFSETRGCIHCCKNWRLFPKYEEVHHGWHQNIEQIFFWVCLDESLESVQCGKGHFFLLGQSQRYSSSWVPKEKICTYWLSVRARRKIFGSKSWRTDRAQRRAKYDRVQNIFLSSSYKLGQ